MKLFYRDIGCEPSLEPPEDDREILGWCDECGEPIREDDDYYEIGGYCYCKACIEDARRCG